MQRAFLPESTFPAFPHDKPLRTCHHPQQPPDSTDATGRTGKWGTHPAQHLSAELCAFVKWEESDPKLLDMPQVNSHAVGWIGLVFFPKSLFGNATPKNSLLASLLGRLARVCMRACACFVSASDSPQNSLQDGCSMQEQKAKAQKDVVCFLLLLTNVRMLREKTGCETNRLHVTTRSPSLTAVD
jgi:hypothetical protein